MKPQNIRVGDILKLKRHNPYGLAPGTRMFVTEIRTKPGYKTPWIICEGWGAFRPSDFSGHATLN